MAFIAAIVEIKESFKQLKRGHPPTAGLMGF
jgi:hypothetical protein